MDIRLSIAARNRNFSRAMRRLRPIVESALAKLRRIELEHPTWTEVLIGIADDRDAGHIETVPNNHNVLQILIGFPSDVALLPANDREILAVMLVQMCTVVRECRLTPADEKAVTDILLATDLT